MGEYCSGISGSDTTVVSSYCDMRVGVLVGRDLFVSSLCLVCL